MSIQCVTMNRFVETALRAFVLACLLASAPAYSAQRTFVSTSGVNNPACSPVAPCRDFASAIAATSSGGEVIVLDSGGYGLVTITKAVSIIAPPGLYAGISVFAAQTGITINAGASDRVVLRGLTISGLGSDTGVIINSGGQIYIEDCTLTGFTFVGINVNGGGSTHVSGLVSRQNFLGVFVNSDGTAVHVSDSRLALGATGLALQAGNLDANRVTIEDTFVGGIRAFPVSAGTVSLALVDVVVRRSTSIGVQLVVPVGTAATLNAVMSRVAISNSASNPGIQVDSSDAGTVTVAIADSTIAENTEGITAVGADTTVILSNSMVARNTGADISSSAVFRTSGNNALTGRGAADIVGTLTPNPPK